MIRKSILSLAALFCCIALQAKDYTVTSPSGTLAWTLDFLAGRTIRLFRDGANSDKVGEDYVLEEFRLEGPLQIHLAPGGGFAAVIR